MPNVQHKKPLPRILQPTVLKHDEAKGILIRKFGPKLISTPEPKISSRDLERCLRVLAALDHPYRYGMYLAAVHMADERRTHSTRNRSGKDGS